MFYGFEKLKVVAGGTIFSTTDTSTLGKKGVSLLNLPSCYDGTCLISDGTNEVNQREISRIQDTTGIALY